MNRETSTPVWLTALWEQKKAETAARITAAVSKLRTDGTEVTYASICSTVRAMDGISISPNTIKRNDRAYEIYLASRRPPRGRCLPDPLLTQTITEAPPEEKRSLQSRITRLRRETKDMLIARILHLECVVGQQKTSENTLRDEVMRLSVMGPPTK